MLGRKQRVGAGGDRRSHRSTAQDLVAAVCRSGKIIHAWPGYSQGIDIEMNRGVLRGTGQALRDSRGDPETEPDFLPGFQFIGAQQHLKALRVAGKVLVNVHGEAMA